MALPAHLAKYDGLIDMIVEQLVREIENCREIEPPAGSRLPAGADSLRLQEQAYEGYAGAASAATSGTRRAVS